MESFIALIDRLNGCADDERRHLEEHIALTFETECAVLALDMSGYSSSVRRDGIIPHLCRIRRMQLLVRPLIERFGGQVVREIADNILAVFPTPRAAVDAAMAVRDSAAALRRASSLMGVQDECEELSTVPDHCLHVSIGVDHGKLLLVADHDCFGDPVNVAFKLGEDVAGAGEILITENVRRQLDHFAESDLVRIDVSASGIEVVAYRLSGAAFGNSA